MQYDKNKVIAINFLPTSNTCVYSRKYVENKRGGELGTDSAVRTAELALTAFLRQIFYSPPSDLPKRKVAEGKVRREKLVDLKSSSGLRATNRTRKRDKLEENFLPLACCGLSAVTYKKSTG